MKRPLAAFAFALTFVGPLVADEAPPPPPLWSGEGTISYVQTGGNSSNKTFGGSLKVLYQPAPWKVELRTAFIRSETDEVVSANRFSGLLRGERALSEPVAVFAQVSYLRDLFAGIEDQVVLEGGATYRIVRGPKHLLSASAALGYADESRVAPNPARKFASGRASVSYHYKLSPTAEFGEDLDFLADLKDSGDWRANNTVSLTASLSKVLALKVGHQLAYLHQPVPGKETTDTTFMASIVAKWPAK